MAILARAGRRARGTPLFVVAVAVALAPAASGAPAIAPAATPATAPSPASGPAPDGPGAPTPARPEPYTLHTPQTPLTAAGCTADPGCVDATGRGAVPDDGGDDHAALAAAVAEVAPAAGTLYLPAGTYLLSRPLYLPAGVTLAGAGLTRTTLLLSWPHLANFSYNFLVAPARDAAADVTVRDLTVDGGRRRGACPDGGHAGACRPNHGGGVKAGTRWTVRQVRFTALNYFKLWICRADDVRVVESRWDNLGAGAGAGGEDNIGGGCGASGVTIAGNRFHESIVGNVIDLTRASSVTVVGNTSERNSILFEGVTDSSITNSTVLRGDINVIANGRYAESAVHGNYNPARVTIARNTVDGGVWGINIGYFNRDGAANHPGGANIVAGNAILRTSRMGIVVSACQQGAKALPDTIERNVVTDSNGAGAASYHSGCAEFDPAGIGLGAGIGDRVTDNRVVDTRTPPLTSYGISVGDRATGCPPTETFLAGNVATGVGSGVIHRNLKGSPDFDHCRSR